MPIIGGGVAAYGSTAAEAQQAANFVAASTQYLSVGSAVVTAVPLTMACWYRMTSAVSADLMALTTAGSNNEGFRLLNDNAGNQIVAASRDAGTQSNAVIAGVPANDTWTHAAAVFASNTSRRAYKNGTGGTINTTSNAPSGLNRTGVGAFIGASIINPHNGDMANAAIWNAALSSDEIAALVAGYSPALIRPEKLVFFLPLNADLLDVKGATVTNNGTVTLVADPDHTRIETFSEPASSTLVADGTTSNISFPRAIQYNGNLYFAYVTNAATIEVAKYYGVSVHRKFLQNFGADDHNAPALYVRTDGKILVMWTGHDDTTGTRYVISSNAEDLETFSSIVVIPTVGQGGITYSGLNYLSGPNKLFLRYRAGDRSVALRQSDDEGSTWGIELKIVTNGGERPYALHIEQGTDKIHFFMTDGNPTEILTSCYHFYAQWDGVGGALKYYKTDGTEITATLPWDLTDNATLVYDGSVTEAFVTGIAIGADGHPRVIFDKLIDATDNRFMFSRWNGAAWTTPVEITPGGGAYIATNPSVTGMGCFDSSNPDIVYLGVKTGAGVHEIQEWRTTDSGATWAKNRDITTASPATNARPYSPRNRVAGSAVTWWQGTHTAILIDTKMLRAAAA